MDPTETRSQVVRLAGGPCLRYRREVLVVTEGPSTGVELELTDRPVVLGRDEGVDLRLEDGAVSREHARLEPTGEGWRILDLGSKSGTVVGDVRVESAEVPPDTPLRMGASVVVLRAEQAEVSAPPSEGPKFEGLLGSSPAMRETFGLVDKVGPLDLPVLLRGETGTGKERLARSLHSRGRRPDGPYVVVDCTLLGEGESMRSELFGHVKGAFTGADRDRPGAFVRASGGTLFLDEVGELDVGLQPQLLRVLQEGEVRPLGSGKVERVRVRVVAATNRDLGGMVAAGSFRQDLFYRLSAVTLEVPALRQRGEDLFELAAHFLPEGVRLSPEAREAMRRHPWPGNVRELELSLTRAAALCQGGVIAARDLGLRTLAPVPATPAPAPAPVATNAIVPSRRVRTASIRNEQVLAALQRAGGNRHEAARALGMSRATLFRRLRKMRDAGDELPPDASE